MPVFEFICEDCDRKFELLVGVGKSNGADGKTCPACGSADVKKLFSAFAARSAGGGETKSLGSSCGSCASTKCNTCAS